MSDNEKKLTYESAGVSISEGDALVERLAKTNKNIGGFSGAFPLSVSGMSSPLLLASTDGVGTKLLLAQQMQKLDTIGIDLVAMVINDLVVCGASPLFFLDYYATGKLNAPEADAILSGIIKGCETCSIPLLGGETAEMPGLYKAGDFDLAGFGVGIVDQPKVIDGNEIQEGDLALGISSSGIHSNGYSLVRAVIDHANLDLTQTYHDFERPLGEELLEPTVLYSPIVLSLLEELRPHGMCHITGGGLQGNLIRVLPEGKQLILQRDSWKIPSIFPFLQKAGDLDQSEMDKVFNLGIGYVLILSKDDVEAAQKIVSRQGLESFLIGEIQSGNKDVLFSENTG